MPVAGKPKTKVALDALLALSPTQRGRVLCWFCDACHEHVGPGKTHRCKAGSEVYAPDPNTSWEDLNEACKRRLGFDAIGIALACLGEKLDPDGVAETEKGDRDTVNVLADIIGSSGDTHSRDAATGILLALEKAGYVLKHISHAWDAKDYPWGVYESEDAMPIALCKDSAYAASIAPKGGFVGKTGEGADD